MASSYFTLKLDTTAPSGRISFDKQITNTKNITARISADDDTIQMKIWGDIVVNNEVVTENSASWINYSESYNLTLSDVDGTKTIHIKFIDDVGNVSAGFDTSIILDTAAPRVTVSNWSPDKISRVNEHNTCTFKFSADDTFVQWAVCAFDDVNEADNYSYDVHKVIPINGGSENMTGTETTVANAIITCKINSADLAYISPGDGAKLIKVFVKDSNGNWSI